MTDLPRVPRKANWRDYAACAELANFTELTIKEQKEVCATCPVLQKCLKFAITNEPVLWSAETKEWPVYGGLSGTERQVLIRLWKAAQRALAA